MRKILFPLFTTLLLSFAGCAGGDKVDGDGSEGGGGGGGGNDADGDGYSTADGDCDDDDPNASPAGDEVCDGVDNDCDGKVDDEDGSLDKDTLSDFYPDNDGDGYGDDDGKTTGCEAPDGYVNSGGDCDDDNVRIFPGADERCDDVDNDCNGKVDDEPVDGDYYAADKDGDGFGAAGTLELACDGVDNDWDCDDRDDTEPQVVDASATGRGDGSSSNPFSTIQEGIDGASDCVIVYAGTYREAIDYSGKSLVVTGVEGASRTIINASGLDSPAVTFDSREGSGAVLTGFTLTGGEGHLDETEESSSCGSGSTCTSYYSTWCGGGVYANGASPTLVDLIITDNTLPEAATRTSGDDTYYTYSFGGGLCFVNATPSLEGVNITGNFADQGGAIYVDESSVVEQTTSYVMENTATDGGAFAVDGGSLILTNVVVTWNEADSQGGGAVIIDGKLSATNVTFGEDAAPTGGGLSVADNGDATVMNSIIYGANDGAGVQVESGSSFDGTYNNVYGNADGGYSGVSDPTGSDGNIASDPRFTSVSADGNPNNDDWSLKSGSPSIDAGNPAASYRDADGSTNDQGAYGGPNSDWD